MDTIREISKEEAEFMCLIINQGYYLNLYKKHWNGYSEYFYFMDDDENHIYLVMCNATDKQFQIKFLTSEYNQKTFPKNVGKVITFIDKKAKQLGYKPAK